MQPPHGVCPGLGVGVRMSDEITAVLDTRLLTDAELVEGEPAWREYRDPFSGCFESKERNQE